MLPERIETDESWDLVARQLYAEFLAFLGSGMEDRLLDAE